MDVSELSELTDEEATPDIRTNTRSARADSDDEGSDGPPPRVRKSGGGKRKSRSRNPRKSSASGSASRRKKRGGMVPAPMWDWAYKNGSVPPTAAPSASGLVATSHPGPGPTTTSHTLSSTGAPTNSLPNHTTLSHVSIPRRPKSTSTTPDAEEEEEEEQPASPRAMEEEEGEEGDPDHRARDHVEDDADDDDDDVEDEGEEDENDEEEDEEGEEDIDVGPSSRSRQKPSPVSHRSLSNTSRTRNPRTSKSVARADEDEAMGEDDVDADEMDVDGDGPDDLAEGSGTEEDYPDRQYPNRGRLANSKHPRPSILASSNRRDPGTAAELKDAGRDVLQDAQGIPPFPLSAPESPREPTPDDEDVDQNDGIDDGADDQEGDEEAPDEEEPSPTDPDADPDHLVGRLGEIDGDDHITAHDDRESNIDEAEEPDEDPDLQPAHRAEALDVLATIEIKFAMLRERVYVEKMEGLAWEEALVWEGTHPELHHLQEELTKRRDKRLMLAERKREYEIGALERKRKEEEVNVWDHWEHARDELQTDMVAETNRKRRKLERERRALERPVGARGIPVPILNPPPAPTLREIVNTTPLPSHLVHLVSNASKKLLTRSLVNPTLNAGLGVGYDGLGPNPAAYPDLPTLAPADIATDLDYLFQHRRAGFGYGYGMFPAVPGVGFHGVGPGIGPGMGFGHSIGGAGLGFNGVPGVGFGINGSGPGEMYPPNTGPGMAHPGAVPPPVAGPSMPLPQPHPEITGPGIGPTDSPGFGQPSAGVFQPGVGRENAYPLGSGGPALAQGDPETSGRNQRTSGSTLDRERESTLQRERELVARDRDRELPQREREMRECERERVRDINNRDRERGEFMSNVGPRYQSSEWNPKPSGGVDWSFGDRRREEDMLERERERERAERERSQGQPMTGPPIPHHQNQHSHSLHHPHPSHSQHLTHPSHPPHLGHSGHSQPPSHHQHHHPHPHSQHQVHQHTQHQHGPTGNAPHHHHVGQHHHRHHYHVLHHHPPGSELRTGPASGTSAEGSGIRHGQGHGQTSTTMEIINLSAGSSKALWKREEGKFGGTSLPGSRPSSTHPPFSVYDERERDRDRDRDRDRERDRDRPVATPFVIGPSPNSLSAASSPRHNWPHGDMGGPHPPGGPGALYPPPSERFHSPVSGSSGTQGVLHRFSNPPPSSHLHRQSPNSLTTSPSRSGPPASPSSANLVNPGVPSSSANTSSSPGPFHTRKSSPNLPPPSKLGMSPLVYSPRLAGPGVLPPTGPGVPGVLSGAVSNVLSGPSSGPGIPPSGILTSGPGIPPTLAMPQGSSGPGIGGGIPPSGPPPIGMGDGQSMSGFTGSRTESPLMFASPRAGPPPIQKIGVEGV